MRRQEEVGRQPWSPQQCGHIVGSIASEGSHGRAVLPCDLLSAQGLLQATPGEAPFQEGGVRLSGPGATPRGACRHPGLDAGVGGGGSVSEPWPEQRLPAPNRMPWEGLERPRRRGLAG